MPAKRIEQNALQSAIKQCLLIVLAVDLDQLLAERTQLGQGDRPAVDPGPRLASAANHATQFAGVLVVKFFATQPRADVAARADIEGRRQLRTLTAMPDHGRVATAARQEQQGINQQ